MSDSENASLQVLAIIVAFGLMAFFLAYYAAVFVLLWGWFVVPLGARALTWPWAVGLISLVALLQPVKKDAPLSLERWVDLFVKPLMVLAIGAIAHAAM